MNRKTPDKLSFKDLVLIILAIIFIVFLVNLMGDAHEYPCGMHLNNGYYRACD